MDSAALDACLGSGTSLPLWAARNAYVMWEAPAVCVMLIQGRAPASLEWAESTVAHAWRAISTTLLRDVHLVAAMTWVL